MVQLVAQYIETDLVASPTAITERPQLSFVQ